MTDKAEGKPKADKSAPQAEEVDRPGFDLGGSTGKTRAGRGLGLDEDAADRRKEMALPGRRGTLRGLLHWFFGRRSK